MNNAQILAKSLVDLGVKRVFGFSGVTIMPVIHALDESGIEIGEWQEKGIRIWSWDHTWTRNRNVLPLQRVETLF